MTRGVRIVNLGEGDSVAAVAVISHEDLSRGIDGVSADDSQSDGAEPDEVIQATTQTEAELAEVGADESDLAADLEGAG
jgi:hypothetical protein